MKIVLDIPEEILEKLQIEANRQHRSRKNLMEAILIDFDKKVEQPKTSIQNFTEQPSSNYTINIPAPKVDKPKNTTTNKIEGSGGAVIDKSEIESQISLLRQAEESCAKTSLGIKAKAAYQKQREELEKKLK